MRKCISISLVGLGIICLAWVGVVSSRGSAFQREQKQALALSVGMVEAPVTPPAPVFERLAHQALVGQLEIARVGLSVMVAEGDDDATLEKAVGHLPDTVLPWEPGNSALAGHRDTFFRPLRGVRVGDEIRLTSPRGVLVYQVSETFITDPSDIGILKARGRNELTLVTCFPFGFVGNAPKRFIVRAERLDIGAPRPLPVLAASR